MQLIFNISVLSFQLPLDAVSRQEKPGEAAATADGKRRSATRGAWLAYRGGQGARQAHGSEHEGRNQRFSAAGPAVTLTGIFAVLEVAQGDAEQLAMDEINAAGGVPGRGVASVEVGGVFRPARRGQ